MKWACGVTTVPSRKLELLPRTLTSLAAAGFDKPHLFVDGASDGYGEATYRMPVIRAYGNWILGLAELYIRNPTADRYAMFQDDFVMCKGVRKYLEQWYPERGYLNLYTFPSNERKQGGWYESALLNSDPKWQTGRGAVALVFNRKAVQILLTHQHMVDKPDDVKVTRGGWLVAWRKIDGAVVTAMNKAGWREYVHMPSLTQHVGARSTVANLPHKSATSFPGEEYSIA